MASDIRRPLPAAPSDLPPSGADPAALAPELRFLLHTVAAGLDGAAVRAPAEISWPDFLACLNHHRLAPLIGPALRPEAGLPGPVRAELAQRHRAATARAMALATELARLARRFEAAGIEMLALKGPALSMLLFDDPCRRHCRDLDLLVRPGDEPAARTLLAGCGYGTTPEAVFPAANAVTLLDTRRRLTVELHVRIADDDRIFPLAAFRPFDSALEMPFGGTTVRTLSREAAVVHAAHHGGKHWWLRLYWLADIAAATGRPNIRWPDVAALARRTGTERQLELALRLSTALLGRRLPELPELDRRGLWAVRRNEACLPKLLTVPPLADLETIRQAGRLRMLGNSLALLRRPAARWGLLRVWLRPTATDRAAMPLPPALEVLGYGVRIARILWQALTARRRAVRR